MADRKPTPEEEAALRALGMWPKNSNADIQGQNKRPPEPPSGVPFWKQFSLDDFIVFIVCECFAAPINIAAGEAFVNLQNGREWYGWSVGVPLAIAGFTFHWWKRWLAEPARAWIAVNAKRWALLVIIAAIVWAYAYVVAPDIYRRATAPVALTGAIGVMPIGTTPASPQP